MTTFDDVYKQIFPLGMHNADCDKIFYLMKTYGFKTPAELFRYLVINEYKASKLKYLREMELHD